MHLAGWKKLHFSFDKYYKIIYFSFLVATCCPKKMYVDCPTKLVLPDSECCSPWLVRL